METKKILKLIFFGILTWLVPFLISIPMYPRGEPVMDIFLVKAILIVLATAFAVFLILVYFRDVHVRYLKEGVLLGGSWLAINWGLDIIILLPLSGMDPATYFAQIGLRYLIIPIMAIGIGYAVEREKSV